jgi:hypothetical protein
MRTGLWCGKLKKRDPFEDLSVDWKIKLERMLKTSVWGLGGVE